MPVVYPIVMYRCENWNVKKAESWRIDTFKLWCWGQHLGVPWTVLRSKKSIPKETNAKYTAEARMLKLKLEDFSNQMPRANIRKQHDAGKDWGQEEKEVAEDETVGWYHQFNVHMFEQTVGNSEREEGLVWCSTGSTKELDMTEWTTAIKMSTTAS